MFNFCWHRWNKWTKKKIYEPRKFLVNNSVYTTDYACVGYKKWRYCQKCGILKKKTIYFSDIADVVYYTPKHRNI